MSNIEDPKIKNRSDVLQSIHTDILRCENIIAIGMSEGESEFMLGVSLPTLNDIVKINLSHALILAFVRLNGELSVSERLRLLFELLGEVQGKQIMIELMPPSLGVNNTSEAIH